VIFVGEATAGPAQHRHLQFLECCEYIVAIPARVGNGGVGSHPDAFVDIAAQVFHELAVDVGVDLCARLIGTDRELNRGRVGGGGDTRDKRKHPRRGRGDESIDH
jgi:hypothetical protein